MKTLLSRILFLIFTLSFFGFQDYEKRKIDGKDYVVYKVQQGDGWYAIARKFGISYAELRVANKDSDDKLFPGKEVFIPGKLKANDPYFEKNFPSSRETKTGEVKYHVVEKSQTLFSISKMNGITVDQLKTWNRLTSNSLTIGQKLIVSDPGSIQSDAEPQKPQTAPEPVKIETPVPQPETIVPQESVKEQPPVVKEEVKMEQPVVNKDSVEPIDTSVITSTVEDLISPEESKKEVKKETVEAKPAKTKKDEIVFANGRHEVNETGMAMFTDEADDNADKYYAFHRTATVGTVIRVLNLNNSRKIYVKVTGILPDESGNDGILIKLSKASAEKLGATENTIRVNLLYGMSND